MRLFLILASIIALLAIVFALQNAVSIEIAFGIWRLEESLALVLLLTLTVGFIIGLLVSIPTITKKEWKISNQKKMIVELENKLNENIERISSQRKRINYLESNIKSELEPSIFNESEHPRQEYLENE
ncbi:MAG: LapA family protein [Symploca sp. SIO2G7]|nr:LapA family protein [Symploca sp. SIO2G7]